MEWATVIGAVVGGSIGIAGELIGRIGASRQADRQRREALEDAQRIRIESTEDERLREIWQRSRQAAESIIKAIRNNRISILDPAGKKLSREDVVERALAIWLELYTEAAYILDADLRKRINICESILDMATTPGISIGRWDLAEVVLIVRNDLLSWLGALFARTSYSLAE